MMRINAILVYCSTVCCLVFSIDFDRFVSPRIFASGNGGLNISFSLLTELDFVMFRCCTEDARSVGPCISIHAILCTADRLRSQWIAKSAPLKNDAQSEQAEGIIHKWDPTISQRFTSATIPEPAIEGSPECLVGEQWHSRHGRPTSKCVRTQGLRIDWKREAGGVRCPRLARRRWDA